MPEILGMLQIKIQKGVGKGTITIDPIDPSKSIILVSTVALSNVATSYKHATIVNETTINCDETVAWTVIEFGGAI